MTLRNTEYTHVVSEDLWVTLILCNQIDLVAHKWALAKIGSISLLKAAVGAALYTRASENDEAGSCAESRRRRNGCCASSARGTAAEQSVARGAGRIGGESHGRQMSDARQVAQRKQHLRARPSANLQPVVLLRRHVV